MSQKNRSKTSFFWGGPRTVNGKNHRRASFPLTPWQAFEAVDGAADLVEFAYEHGFHEEGFDRPSMLRALAKMLAPREAP